MVALVEDWFTLSVRGKLFQLSPAQLEFDPSPSFVAQSNCDINNILLSDRSPYNFQIISNFLSGYDILPVNDNVGEGMNGLQTLKSLLVDAEEFELRKLIKLLEEEIQNAVELKKPTPVVDKRCIQLNKNSITKGLLSFPLPCFKNASLEYPPMPFKEATHLQPDWYKLSEPEKDSEGSIRVTAFPKLSLQFSLDARRELGASKYARLLEAFVIDKSKKNFPSKFKFPAESLYVNSVPTTLDCSTFKIGSSIYKSSIIFEILEGQHSDLANKLGISRLKSTQLDASNVTGFFYNTEIYILHGELAPVSRNWATLGQLKV